MANLSIDLAAEVHLLKERLSMNIVDESYHPQSFGDALVTLSGPLGSIRLVRERGQIFLDIGTGSKWTDANVVLEAANLHPAVGAPLDGKQLVPVVCSNFQQIRKYLDQTYGKESQKLPRDTMPEFDYVRHDFSKGWPTGREFLYRCLICGDLIPSFEAGQCTCGNIHVAIGGIRGAKDPSKVWLAKKSSPETL